MAPPPRGKKKQEKNDHDEEEEESPELSPVDSAGEEEEESDGSVYDSEDDHGGGAHYTNDDAAASAEDDDDDDDDEEEDEEDFENQGSSDDDDDRLERQRQEEESDDEDIAISYEKVPRSWKIEIKGKKRSGDSKRRVADAAASAGGADDEKKPAAANDSTATTAEAAAKVMHTDDWSSDDDDEEGTGNRIGRVPIHWYDDYDHVGYNVHGSKVAKSASADGTAGDRIDQAIALQDNMAQGKFVVHDALNDTNVELSARQVELIRRMQASAVAHPEHEANPEYIDYFSGVNPEISGLNSNQYEPKARFQPSRWEKLQVERLLDRLAKGKINMDYLTGKIKDMNDVHRKNKNEADPNKPFLLWTGNEDDELNMRKGPQHIAAPKKPPPGHAESYIPPDEYLPTEEEKKQWEETEVHDRPHGLLVPKKFPNLRSVGAYQHSVRETFERCLDLYLCPRVLKRRLNIDPESLVPRLPRANDLRPFPTAKCIEYKTPYDENATAAPPVIRCVTASPNGQFMASGASDGYVRLWEVETGRLLQSWNLSKIATDLDVESAAAPPTANEEVSPDAPPNDGGATSEGSTVKPVARLEWNPNRSHHCLLAAVGKCVVVIATGTAGAHDAEITAALLLSGSQGGNVTNPAAGKAVKWNALQQKRNKDNNNETTVAISIQSQGPVGPVCALLTTREVADVRWQAKGDYFVSVSPKAQASAVLIHQLSRGNSQRPFSKAKGEAQLACFHPNKPFLFVASQQHVRIYHLVKQSMVKRLISGCRWISSIDVHPSGDHLIVGSLDRRAIWFDLDLSSSPYKTLKYHERALRSCRYHGRYPLMATASDDGVVHVFHSMVYSDLMRNPLIVPVKILRGHDVTKNKLGVLALTFHPTQPWLFTAGADGRIFLYQDI